MEDFRKRLYEKYVSTYKAGQVNMGQGYLKGRFAWYKFKYLPLLKGLSPDASILELGCGCGEFTDFLRKQKFSNVQSIDISQEQANIALKRGLNVKVADVFAFLGSRVESFDAIIAIDFIEHFTKEEIMEIFDKIKTALKKNGILIITTLNARGLFPHQVIYDDFTHLTILSPESLKQILTFFAFTDAKFYETRPAPKDITGIARSILWQMVKFSLNLLRRIEANKTQQIWTENFICCCRKA